MNITVAQRVIGGFAIISALLLVVSITSLSSLDAIDDATDEVNQIAIPTLTSSSALKASFTNMGRITFEAFIEETQDGLTAKKASYQASRSNFQSELSKLNEVVKDQVELNDSLTRVEAAFAQYAASIESMLKNREMYLTLYDQIDVMRDEVEANADDASTLILDFSEMDEVENNRRLQNALDVGSELEVKLLALLSIAGEYVKTDTLQRADTVGNEVMIIADQVTALIKDMVEKADGQDDSGTIDEIEELVNVALEAATGDSGLMALHVSRLKEKNEAQAALLAAEKASSDGIIELETLLGLSQSKVASIEESVQDSVDEGIYWTIAIVVVSVLVAAGIGYFTVTAITRPLKSINAALNVASSGDLTHKLDDSAQDEFGELARNVNMLVDSLKSLISGIKSRAEQLAAASEQTSAVTVQTTQSIQNQKSQISQAATATTEMHSTSQVVTQNAEDTLKQIQDADDQAKRVRQISMENRETIEVLACEVGRAGEVINKLHQDSASIGGILDVIRGVADQTNLLALNAAIEAARAGEYGRGFAVVADEVRTLASRTQESTQEINAMIEVLQAGAEEAVSAMNQGKEQTDVCVEKTESATKALDTITEAVHRAHDVSTQIEQSAREQNVVSQEISEKLESIVGIAEETSIGAQQTADSSHEVARLAEELQLSITQFKV